MITLCHDLDLYLIKALQKYILPSFSLGKHFGNVKTIELLIVQFPRPIKEKRTVFIFDLTSDILIFFKLSVSASQVILSLRVIKK